MEYALLGPLEVRSDGRTIAVGRGKQRALIAVLALNAGRVVPTERLIDELWGEEPPATASTALQVYVSRLRKSLGENAIETREPGYLVEGEVDVRRFDELVSEARRSEPRRAAELLSEALGLWRGAALCDCELPLEAARLEEQRVAAIEQRIEADLASGRSSELVGELEVLVAEHPLRESFRAQLMLALYRAGRQAEALDSYRATRAALLDELGIEPSPRLQQLEQAILRHDDSLAAAAEQTLTATALFAFVVDVHRFPSARHLASYLGLTPRERSSGTRLRSLLLPLASATRRANGCDAPKWGLSGTCRDEGRDDGCSRQPRSLQYQA